MDILFDQFKIEVVTEKDEHKVLSIRKPEEVYEGRDYLPSTFKDLINFPNSTGYAVSHGDKYIAFTLVNLIDKGETYIVRAVRIAKQYEGKGVIRWFLKKIDDIVKVTTAAKYKVSVSRRGDIATDRRVKEGMCYTVSNREMVFFSNVTDVQALKTRLALLVNNTLNIDIISKSELTNILEYVAIHDNNDGRLVVNMIPFRPIRSNVSFIMQESPIVIGSDLNNAGHWLITFGNLIETFAGPVVTIDIYGHVSNGLQNHIMLHLKHLLISCEANRLTLKLLYASNIQGETIKQIMKQCRFNTKDIEDFGCIGVETKV